MEPKRTKIIAYHFVRDNGGDIHAISCSEFRRQLEYVKKHGENQFILTFDDGYKDHVDNVLPALQEYGLKGIFFPCIAPLENHTVFDFNKNQFIAAKVGYEKMAEHFEKFSGIVLDRERNHYNRFDTPLVGNYKLALYRMEKKEKDIFLNRLFKKYCGDEIEFSKKLYMDWKDLSKLRDCGMEIGSHSWSHAVLDSIEEKGYNREILDSKKILGEKVGIKVEWFCYPCGRYNLKVIEALKRHGYKYAVTTELGESSQDNYLLKRIDAKELIK